MTATTPLIVVASLTCCAIPIVLVAVGAGSVVASLVSVAPWAVTLSRHKEWVFLVGAVALVTNYVVLYRSRAPACQPGGVCHPSHPVGRAMRITYWASVLLYAVGLAAAYLSLPLARLFGY